MEEEKKVDRDQVWPGTSIRLITEEYQGAGWQVQEDDTRTRVQVQDDDGRKLRGRDIVVGMHDSAYNPKAFKVVATYAAQIKGMQMDSKHKTRDS